MKMIMTNLIVAIIVVFLLPITIFAGQGCCSWHGGQDYCDTCSGRWVCNDGTYSPSCTCSYIPSTCRNYTSPTPTITVEIRASFSFTQTDNKTFTVFVNLDDPDPTSYSYSLNKYGAVDPGNLADSISPHFFIEKVKAGMWFLNLKKLMNGRWTNIIYWQVETPTWVPSPIPSITPIPTKTPIPTITSTITPSPKISNMEGSNTSHMG